MKTWEMSNNMETISTVDEIYRYDRKQQQDILTAKPWDKEYVDNMLALSVAYNSDDKIRMIKFKT